MDIEKILVDLVEALEEDLGVVPERIILEPQGDVAVNARVGLRGETHPQIYYVRRDEDVHSDR